MKIPMHQGKSLYCGLFRVSNWLYTILAKRSEVHCCACNSHTLYGRNVNILYLLQNVTFTTYFSTNGNAFPNLQEAFKG